MCATSYATELKFKAKTEYENMDVPTIKKQIFLNINEKLLQEKLELELAK